MTLYALYSHETQHTQWEHPRTGRTKTLARGKMFHLLFKHYSEYDRSVTFSCWIMFLGFINCYSNFFISVTRFIVFIRGVFTQCAI